MREGSPVQIDGQKLMLPLQSRIEGIRRVTTVAWIVAFQEELDAIDQWKNGRLRADNAAGLAAFGRAQQKLFTPPPKSEGAG